MFKIFKILCVVLMIPILSSAEEGDVAVGDVDISNLTWGDQTLKIELENKTDIRKYIITHTDLSFEGTYVNPSFRVKTVYVLEPMQKLEVAPTFTIPGNYGTVTIDLALYDVVDTLDEIMPWTKFYEQPFIIKFTPSDEALSYLQEKITFPPRVNVHPYFNNEFVRILFKMLNEGKSVAEIATINKCSEKFVQSQIDFYMQSKKLTKTDNGYTTTFPFISKSEAEAGRKIADQVSDKLSAIIAENLKSYQSTVDSLADAKLFPKDKYDFLTGATLMYSPTPFVSTLSLWFELGRKFITRSAPLLIYDNTDICNANIPQYMYMVDGGDYVNGTQFFGLFYGDNQYSILFSEDALQVKCQENFESTQPKKSGIWEYDYDRLPEFYIIDSSDTRPLIDMTVKGCDEVLNQAYEELKNNAIAHGHPKAYIGHRYWFWNLTATLTLNKLYKNGALTKQGSGYYRLDKVKQLK